MVDYRHIIDKYYSPGSRIHEILTTHSRYVADFALSIAKAKSLQIDFPQIEAAAMLHDIGIFKCNAPGIECHGDAPYLLHGCIGGQLLRQEGMPEWAARVAERHTGTGLTSADFEREGIVAPSCNCMPETLLELLICYADKFFSKSGDMRQKELSKVIASISKHGQEAITRFQALHSRFNI